MELGNTIDLSDKVLTVDECRRQFNSLSDEVLNEAIKHITEMNEKTVEQVLIVNQHEKIQKLQQSNRELESKIGRLLHVGHTLLNARPYNTAAVHEAAEIIDSESAAQAHAWYRDVTLCYADALGKLLYAKEYKDRHGKDAHYETCREIAWDAAYKAIKDHDYQSFKLEIQAEAFENAKIPPNAKAGCIGEFSFPVMCACPTCYTDGHSDDCELCQGESDENGMYLYQADVPWNLQKDIWKRMSQFAAAHIRQQAESN